MSFEWRVAVGLVLSIGAVGAALVLRMAGVEGDLPFLGFAAFGGYGILFGVLGGGSDEK